MARSSIDPRSLLFVIAALFSACATLPERPVLGVPAPADATELRRAAEAFYSAESPEALREAVSRAERAGPDSAIRHELAAELALLEDRTSDAFEHLYRACLDPEADATALYLHQLESLPWTASETLRFGALVQTLTETHPDPEVRAIAAWFLSEHRHNRADPEGRDAAVARLGWVLPLQVIGGWDNDQGKGFDLPLPPESGVDLEARYPGALMDLGWVQPPRSYRGEIALGEFISPEDWSVAYAFATVHPPQPGAYELRISTTDPLKVWVNGALVAEVSELRDFAFDQLVIPIDLPQGSSEVLIKSAHQRGDWKLLARLTPAEARSGKGDGWTAKKASFERTEGVAGKARRAHHIARWASLSFGRSLAVQNWDNVVSRVPSITARVGLLEALWRNDERGRTSDLLHKLGSGPAQALASIPRRQARYWRQEGLHARARRALEKLVEANPDHTQAWVELASSFESERWIEDRCNSLETLNARSPESFFHRRLLAECFAAEDREDRAIEIHRWALSHAPLQIQWLDRLHTTLRTVGDLDGAIEVGRKAVAARPELLWPRIRLAETLRRAGKLHEAESLLREAHQRFPDSPRPLRELGKLLLRAGRTDEAAKAWQDALVRDPRDELTANRLEHLVEEESLPWLADVPDEAMLEQWVARREKLAPVDANYVVLGRRDVMRTYSDGSSTMVYSRALHALNESGRDELTRTQLAGGGRRRVRLAWAINPDGKRIEPSIRDGVILFRGLEVGSTVVIQYRTDSPPKGNLSRYPMGNRWFNFSNAQVLESSFVLWRPADTPLHVNVRGPIETEERRVGDEVRVAWTARNPPMLVAEPWMPTLDEVNASLDFSLVPDWATFQRWQDAILQDAFRTSPEIEALAARLTAGSPNAEETLLRIHEYVMKEIRYQQDYESVINGWKPHPAPMVVERKYGDCKDKTVLFMTLAKLAGIETRFAKVRTREKGPILPEIPGQQFNHVIVYVPEQPGVPVGRFFDPTADALDLDTVRDDDVGTLSFVYDQDRKSFEWRPIEFQTGVHVQRDRFVLSLDRNGDATGELWIDAEGRPGSQLRIAGRRREHLAKGVQMDVANYKIGATVSDVEPVELADLRRPATIRARITAPKLAREDAGSLKLRLPFDLNPSARFSLAERKLPLVLGTPNTYEWRYELTFPEGMRPTRLPENLQLEGACYAFSRKVEPTGNGVAVDVRLHRTCERIAPERYGEERQFVETIKRHLDEELVLEPAKPAKRPGAPRQLPLR